ncbi:MAG: hypothetical protein LW809_03530 [Vampirovibrionales bacterium]|jgi:hypothetical protein|nr:hypothetical protein [Vampirovibrionales bacterium]
MSLHTLSSKNAPMVAKLLEAQGFQATQWMSPLSPKLWLYTLLATLSGGQMPFPHIQAWQKENTVLGVSIMQSDPFMTFRRYLTGFDVEASLENASAIESDFLEALFQFNQTRGVRYILVELSPLDTIRLNLLKHQGFQVALQDAFYDVPSSLIETPPRSEGETALRQAGYKRVMPAHYKAVCDHYNQQLPLLWKQALGKLPQHFKAKPNTERWYLPLDAEQDASACKVLVDIKAPVDPSSHVWNLWILAPLHQVVDAKGIVTLFASYIRTHDALAVIRLQVNQSQTALKEGVEAFLQEAVEEQSICLIKELKARPRSGIKVHVPSPHLGLDATSPAFGMKTR